MNNIGTMIGVNGGPVPEDTSASNDTNTLNMGPNGYLNKVSTGNGGDWYPKKEEVIPRVYHKYYKGCKNKEEGDNPENPPVEDNTGSNTDKDPENPPTPSEDDPSTFSGSFIMDSEE